MLKLNSDKNNKLKSQNNKVNQALQDNAFSLKCHPSLLLNLISSISTNMECCEVNNSNIHAVHWC